LNLGYTEIRAPIAGRVSRALITEGNLVAAGTQVLATIESLDTVYAYFDASEAVFLRFTKQGRGPLKSAAEVIPIQLGLLDEPGYPHAGRIESFDNRINVDTGAIRTRAVFDNRKREFTPGLYARLRLVSGPAVPATLIPDRAIETDQSKKFVMVVGSDDVAAYRDVQPGALQDGLRVIVAGLKPGERVVVDGLQRVRPGAKVAAESVKIDDREEGNPTIAGAGAR
ncbi:MAG TPA: efflux RND transporter periplasmic adaptor subunit, partial [Thermomicrobiales bacterium]|nr:efflux RND transporter periplasmic adaptor subunit [Thermomicrobiales bacterium]